MAKPTNPVERRQRRVAITGMLLLLAVLIAGSIVLGDQILSWISDPGMFRQWAQGHGIWGKLALIGINTLQVVLAFIPGEPVEIAAGIAFGPIQGMLLVLCGTMLGTCLIFLLTKKLGMRFVELFVSPKQRAAGYAGNRPVLHDRSFQPWPALWD